MLVKSENNDRNVIQWWRYFRQMNIFSANTPLLGDHINTHMHSMFFYPQSTLQVKLLQKKQFSAKVWLEMEVLSHNPTLKLAKMTIRDMF